MAVKTPGRKIPRLELDRVLRKFGITLGLSRKLNWSHNRVPAHLDSAVSLGLVHCQQRHDLTKQPSFRVLGPNTNPIFQPIFALFRHKPGTVQAAQAP